VSQPVNEIISGGGSLPPINYWVIIANENQSYANVIGSGAAPYIDSLVAKGATIPLYNGSYPGSSASDYTAEISGDIYGVSDGVSNCSLNHPTIVDRFNTAGKTWAGIQESSNPTGNSLWNSGSFRGSDHFGFTVFSSICTSPSLILGNNQQVNPNTLISLYNGPNPPNYVWYTPNDSNNMHDVSIQTGDAYLGSWVPQLLATPPFTSGQAVLMLWWDESADDVAPCPNVFVGGHVKLGYVSPAANYGHYSTLRTLENLWGLSPLTTGDIEPDSPSPGGDTGATVMSDLFR
jgi:phosphatidylinositol-3-phosphatase